ncbi:MAG: sulfite exporter TauE/SafE family protein [Pseudomonadota bacterium]
MLPASIDFPALAIVLTGALLAGFTTGFAGFGTGLVASGLWFLALPAPMVPPLIALASVAAQLVGVITVRKAFAWRRAAPFLLGGVIGIPLGVIALSRVAPDLLRAIVGVFLVAYASYQLALAGRQRIGDWGGRAVDSLVGIGGGFLGGFVGLSGPPPLIWLQLKGGPSDQQRAVYQPFNLVVLALASLGMGIGGQVTVDVLWVAALCLPVVLISSWAGARIYVGVSETLFQNIVLGLLFASGTILVAQEMMG